MLLHQSTLLINNNSMVDLEPFCIFIGHSPRSVAFWQPQATGQPALALFSTAEKAHDYATEQGYAEVAVIQLRELELVKLLVELFSQGISHAALDPDPTSARSLFDLRQVLRAARQQLGSEQTQWPKPSS
jgi:hypothetical protein